MRWVCENDEIRCQTEVWLKTNTRNQSLSLTQQIIVFYFPYWITDRACHNHTATSQAMQVAFTDGSIWIYVMDCQCHSAVTTHCATAWANECWTMASVFLSRSYHTYICSNLTVCRFVCGCVVKSPLFHFSPHVLDFVVACIIFVFICGHWGIMKADFSWNMVYS